jgi:hypothetical protein
MFEVPYSIFRDSVHSYRAEVVDMVGQTLRETITIRFEERDTLPPEILLLFPSEPNQKVKSSEVKILGIASDDKGVQMVFVNSEPCTMSEPPLEELQGKSIPGIPMQFERTVSLQPGANTFEIIALDLSSNISTKSFTVIGPAPMSANAVPEVILPKTWAVVVGISDFRNENLKLQYAARDARLFYDFLKSKQGGELPEDRIELLMNGDATRANILRQIEDKMDKAGPDDRVIVYIASHGMPAPRGNDVYILGADSDPENLVGTAVSWNDIDREIALSAAKNVFLITDACHSGAAAEEGLRSGAEMATNGMMERIAESKKGIIYFSATTADEFSREGEKWGGHGVFTKFLVEGLKGAADRNKDGKITIAEIDDYVRSNVIDETQGKQRPTLKGEYTDDIIMSVVK